LTIFLGPGAITSIGFNADGQEDIAYAALDIIRSLTAASMCASGRVQTPETHPDAQSSCPPAMPDPIRADRGHGTRRRSRPSLATATGHSDAREAYRQITPHPEPAGDTRFRRVFVCHRDAPFQAACDIATTRSRSKTASARKICHTRVATPVSAKRTNTTKHAHKTESIGHPVDWQYARASASA